jgi:hypothetical protein
MRIVTPETIEQVAWEGHLAPLWTPDQQSWALGPMPKDAASLPRVTLGEPVWWPAERAMEAETGKRWVPPAGGRQYLLLRLACTLHPPAEGRARYAEAVLATYLRPAQGGGQVVAHDLYPQRLTAENKGTFTVGLGPDLKFAEVVDVSLLEVGAEIEYRRAFPIIQGYGLGESRAYWRFAHHATHPLLGSQSVYAVLDAPGDASGVRLSIELVATLETRLGPVRLGLPQEARAHASRTIGDGG